MPLHASPHHNINNVFIPHLCMLKETSSSETCGEGTGVDWGILPRRVQGRVQDACPFERLRNSGFPWIDPLGVGALAVHGQAAAGAIPVGCETLDPAAARPEPCDHHPALHKCPANRGHHVL